MRKNSGFTLLELMIVIAIMGVLAAVAIPAVIGWLPGYKVRSAIQDLKSDMQLAKLSAIRRNAIVSVAFNVGGNSYTIFVDDGAGGGAVNNGTQEPGEIILKQVSIRNGVIMFGPSFAFGTPWCSFNGRGLPNNGAGSVFMRNAGNDQGRIWLTTVGNVRTSISKDNGATWNDTF